MARTINVLSRKDVERITKEEVEKRLSYMENAFDKLRLRVIEIDTILCNFIKRKDK